MARVSIPPSPSGSVSAIPRDMTEPADIATIEEQGWATARTLAEALPYI